jgi:hypothetical protein
MVVPLTGALNAVPLIVHGIWDALAIVSESTVNANKANNFFISISSESLSYASDPACPPF